MTRGAIVFAIGLMAALPVSVLASAVPPPPDPEPGCTGSVSASTGAGGFNGVGTKTCGEGTPGGGSASGSGPAVVIRVLDCGPLQVTGRVRGVPGDVCAGVRNVCDVASVALLPSDPMMTTTATVQRNADGSWRLIGTDCTVATSAPQVTALAVLREVRRLVPRPGVGIAPPGGVTLVNIQTLLWAQTPVQRSLGSVSLLGHEVALRVRVQRVDWDFGDGQSETTSGPQRRYDPASGCRSVMCPGYWGHVYSVTGPMTVTATVTWSGQYRVDGGAVLDIAGTVTGPGASATLVVKQARGVLVADPGGN